MVAVTRISIGCSGGQCHPNDRTGASQHDGAENMKNAQLTSHSFHLDTPQRPVGLTISLIVGLN
ncbi:hypothetical protein GCM10023063_32700 [Arthrobacter methylotrophus]